LPAHAALLISNFMAHPPAPAGSLVATGVKLTEVAHLIAQIISPYNNSDD
jgi:hypothetical protein